MPKEQVYRWEYEINVPREKLWRFATDTERLNRLAGIFDVEYSYVPLASGGSEVHAKAKKRGITFEWIERPAQWVEPEYVIYTRDYSRGPMTQMIVKVELSEGDSPQQSKLVQTIRVTPRNFVTGKILPYAVGVEIKRGFERAYRLAERWAQSEDFGALQTQKEQRPQDQQNAIRNALSKLHDVVGRPELIERLADHLIGHSDNSLSDLAPYELADTWQANRHQLLRLFLHGTKRGLFDMRFSLLCPRCRRVRNSFASLKELGTSGHCNSCNIDFGLDFDRSIEVSFSPQPLGIGSDSKTYCHAAPMNTPHRHSVWSLAPHERKRVTTTPQLGKFQLLAPQSTGAVFVNFTSADNAPTHANLAIESKGIRGLPETMKQGEISLELRNTMDIPVEVMLSRSSWADDAVTAADVTAMQEFRGLFSGEVVSPGAEFSITNMVFLFSDLVGSTAMYERIGDAPAFALVRDHFDVMKAIYTRNNGALVKTIGDAVMAVFRQSSDAVQAALDMHNEIVGIKDRDSGEPLALRIGLHRGPCIAMEANNVLDYFGTTVNIAARVQGKAGGHQTGLSDQVLNDEGVLELLKSHALKQTHINAELKGISDAFAITLLESTSS